VSPRATVLMLDFFEETKIEEEVLGDLADVVRVDPTSPVDDIVTRARTADAILLGLTPVDRQFIGHLERCRILARYGTGTDAVDVAAAHEAGIVVTNVPNFAVEEVAIHALTLALALIRRLPASIEQVRAGAWDFRAIGPVRRVSTMRFGVVGLGRIGLRLSELARAVGFDVVGTSLGETSGVAHGMRLATLDELLAASDIVSLHVPLSGGTRHLIDGRRLGLMKRGALLINTSRGGIVDTQALLAALRSGHLGGAGIDTVEGEPPTDPALAEAPDLLITPHVGFFSDESVAEMRTKAARQVRLALEGRPVEYPVEEEGSNASGARR